MNVTERNTQAHGGYLASAEFAAQLDRLGEVAARTGLNVAPGQQVIMTAPLHAVPLVRRITEHAYKAGASLVTTFYSDEETTLARYKYGAENTFDTASGWLSAGMAEGFRAGAARMAITGSNPALLAGQNPDHVSRASKAAARVNRPAMEIITNFDVNWCIVAAATPAWAMQVFPDLPEQQAVEKLWQAIFAVSRLTGDDPVAQWEAHNAILHRRAAYLNDVRYDALHFSGPGTDLLVGLADGHDWAGGAEKAGNGIVCNPNIPTEEVFTTPHRLRVEGTVASTKPLSHQGTLIDGIRVRFEAGRIVEMHATRGQDVLERVLDTDEGARRLGEVALVPHSSPISRSGLLFQNTLFDENAASHIALGQSYTKCMRDTQGQDEAALAARGANTSMIHIDWMIGSGEIDVDGLDAQGGRVPLMRKGEWVIEA
ncbi:aminopeptidase [Acetobacter fabarum]|uniref:Aminopeptidase n=1 Tax=Acetobacter fabarum TaxID=483199 RepID=A0A269XXY8_9PROT|nr:aminopeptidase [Acetobacter fabarum]MCH4025823.1 aminopeptidase [Acetobacter fabarum]MCH4054524.1 aminopeptidase [Acetobacter fabarum]MCH4086317.1 aminopeptidase [Acetobacter fabarum]MCH4128679.1 aminopeptidase [Acetobacter fabarum]MCH4138192.1 aminopeptidase [Acetobacter fabarum]